MKKMIMWLLLFIWIIGAGVAAADDTAIYGAGTIDLPPNVLILFDTSGSMSEQDVPGEIYNAATTYAGSWDTDTVYRRSSGNWIWYADKISDLNCAAVENALSTDGTVRDYIGPSPNYGCSGNRRRLRTGNFLNYDVSGVGDTRTRIDVAQEVMTNLINDTEDVRFGLMEFGGWNGGRIVAGCGSSKSNLTTQIAGFTAGGMTPLAETLAEAGLYFAGHDSWYNSLTYTTPVQYRCQKNYVILMTDGVPTSDDDPRLDNGAYVNADGDPIGDYDGDGDNRMNRLDDVAKYLYENDILPNLGDAGDKYETQRIKTYTIGFQTNQQLLMDTADDNHGRGEYYTTSSISGLEAALKEILDDIGESNVSYVSPVVPISRTNQVYAGTNLYLGLFNPQPDGNWFGNVKKFGLDAHGDIIDADGNKATDANGMIKETARSIWSENDDGIFVVRGGAGAEILDQSTRNIYTYLGTSTNLTDSTNNFDKSNPLIDEVLLDVPTSASRDAVIDDVRGVGKNWLLGDILHSEPTVVNYSATDSVIFVGSNDGMLRCIDDDNGRELWAFIPPDQLSRLQLLSDGDNTHEYFIDGYTTVYSDTSQTILIVGERRGGNHYYALDVTNYNDPKFLYKIEPNWLGGGDATLGQSWGRAQRVKIATSATAREDVFLLPGGYDVNEDLAEPDPADNTKGRAAFSIEVDTGSVSSFDFSKDDLNSMNYSVVDIVGIDPTSDGIVNRIYAPDLGGQIFAYHDDDQNGSWSGYRLFSAQEEDGVQRKIFYAPDVVKLDPLLDGGAQEMIFFGTGDRADPEETGVTNRFYGVENGWTSDFNDLDESDLRDVSSDLIQMGTSQQQKDEETFIGNAKGWFFELEDPGEKVISAPIVFSGVVYFTTFVPEVGSGGGSSDPCDTGGESGFSYLYAVDYKTGAAVYPDFYQPDETDGDGNVVEKGKKDRKFKTGKGMTPAPTISISENGADMYITTAEGIKKIKPYIRHDVNMFYWRDR